MDSPVTIEPQKVTAGDIRNTLDLHESYRLLTGKTFLESDMIEGLNKLYHSLKEVLHNIATLSGNNVLEKDVRDKLICDKLDIYSHQRLLSTAQSLSPSPEKNSITDIELKKQTMKISFNSAEAAKEFYTLCNEHNNIYQGVYDLKSSSQEIIFSDLAQIQYFISEICKLDFLRVRQLYPEFDLPVEKPPTPSLKQ